MRKFLIFLFIGINVFSQNIDKEKLNQFFAIARENNKFFVVLQL